MDITPTNDRIVRACKELGLSDAIAAQLLAKVTELAISDGNSPVGSQSPEELRSINERQARREAEIMTLLGTKSSDKLVHDVRNLLNELTLLRAVVALEK